MVWPPTSALEEAFQLATTENPPSKTVSVTPGATERNARSRGRRRAARACAGSPDEIQPGLQRASRRPTSTKHEAKGEVEREHLGIVGHRRPRTGRAGTCRTLSWNSESAIGYGSQLPCAPVRDPASRTGATSDSTPPWKPGRTTSASRSQPSSAITQLSRVRGEQREPAVVVRERRRRGGVEVAPPRPGADLVEEEAVRPARRSSTPRTRRRSGFRTAATWGETM